MELTDREEQYLNDKLEKYLTDENVLKMKNFTQHGCVSTYDHCYSVSRACLLLARRLHLNVDYDRLLSAAMLHDMYLYDWHTIKDKNRLHAFNHATIASRNARRYLGVDEDVQKAIYTHMWPMTITHVPSSKEAIILCLVDKYCSLVETVAHR